MKSIIFALLFLASVSTWASSICIPEQTIYKELMAEKIQWEVGNDEEYYYVAAFVPSEIGKEKLFGVVATVEKDGFKFKSPLKIGDNGDGRSWFELEFSELEGVSIEYTVEYSASGNWCAEVLYEYSFHFKHQKI